MAILSTPVEKAERRLSDIRAELSGARSRLGPQLGFDEGFALREEIALLERKEAAAVDALAHAHEQEAKAAAEAEKAKEVAEVETFRREAQREMPAVWRHIGKLQEQLTAKIEVADAHNKRAAHINGLARKHGLPLVMDGEMLFRATPVKQIPAQYEERTVWKDGAGKSPAVFRTGADGELIPVEGGYVKMRERVQVSPERAEGGTLPGGRLAAAITLVGLNGRRLWPAAK